jgi:hypothetical protein
MEPVGLGVASIDGIDTGITDLDIGLEVTLAVGIGVEIVPLGVALGAAGVCAELGDGGGPTGLAGIGVEPIDDAPVEPVGIGVGLTGSIGVGLATAEGTECVVVGAGATLDTVGMGAGIVGVGATAGLLVTGVGLVVIGVE